MYFPRLNYAPNTNMINWEHRQLGPQIIGPRQLSPGKIGTADAINT